MHLQYILSLIIIINVIYINNTTIFEPLSKTCTNIDKIDACCSCNDLETDISAIKTPERINISPTSNNPLPGYNENIGTSMCMYKNRVIIDNHPDFNDDQIIEDNTLVHTIEYNEDLKAWIHIPIENTPEGYGHTIDCSENYILIGNPGSEVADVTLMVRTETPPWSISMKISEINQMSEFGYSVALDEENTRIAISDPSYNKDTGRVYIYLTYMNLIIDTLDHPTELEGSRFGHDIKINDNLVFVGSPYDNVDGHNNVGGVHIFQQEEGGTKWFHLQSIQPPLTNSLIKSDRNFGWKIAVHNDILVIGSFNGNEAEVYVNENGEWTHKQTLNAPNMSMISKFGTSVAINDNRIVVGDYNFLSSPSALGKVFMYEYSSIYDEWLYCQTFVDTPNSFHTHFGQTIALNDENIMVVSAPGTDSDIITNNNGNIYMFNLTRETHCAGCDGIVNSGAIYDECDICDGDNSTCAGCDGVPNSGITLDYCGVCNGDNTTCLHTAAQIDISIEDCDAPIEYELTHEPANNEVEWTIIVQPVYGSVDLTDNILTYTYDNQQNEDVLTDLLRVEVSDNMGHFRQSTVNVNIPDCSIMGCDGVKNSGKVLDMCGVCDGDNSTCADCEGVVGGPKIIDYCGECVSESYSNMTCLTLVNPVKTKDVQCGQTVTVHNTDYEPKYVQHKLKRVDWYLISDTSYGEANINHNDGTITYTNNVNVNGQEEIWYKVIDIYQNLAVAKLVINIYGCIADADVLGCDGVIGSGKYIDRCGVCDGDNDCLDCNNVPFGTAELDYCGVCGGDNSTCPEKLLLLEYNERIKRGDAIENLPNANGTPMAPPLIIVIFSGVLSIITVAVIVFCFFYNRWRDRKLARTFYDRYEPGIIYSPKQNNTKSNDTPTLKLVVKNS